MHTNQENIHGLKLSTLFQVLVALTIVFACALFYNTELTIAYYDELDELNQEYRHLQEQANILHEASDYLTNQVHSFMLAGDLAHLNAYFEEAYTTRRRENAVLELNKHRVADYNSAAAAAAKSNELMERETYAMRLMVHAYGYDENDLPKKLLRITLSSEDLSLTTEQQMEKARKMVHDDVYQQGKDSIYQNLEKFSSRILLAMEQQIASRRASLQKAVEAARALLVLLVFLILLSAVVLVYLVLKPLTTFLSDIKAKSTLTEVGSYEFRHLARVYNRIYAEKAESDHQKKVYQHKAERDRLTGTYSREYFFEKAEEMIRKAEDEIYIVRVNVRHFKLVNELQGVEKGDRLLREIGDKLNELSEEYGCIASRFTADHFYLCIRKEDFSHIDLVKKIPVSWLTMVITFSYGICQADRETPVIVLCDRANMALGADSLKILKNVYFYNDTFHQQLLQEHEIENVMEAALAERQFCIYIQPKVNVETERIEGGEVLVRWIHPERGLISPGVFISVFEKNGFILSLDYYVWEECCRFLAETKKQGLPTYSLSINVSRLHFYSGELQTKLLQLVETYQLSPSDLELEITESIYADDPKIILKQCSRLQAQGFRIAMDDFGSGYSSLNMLKKMPLDTIKMDLRFLADDTDAIEAAKGHDILRTQIELSHTLGIDVVVEGLETEEQRDFIKNIGNCVAQGYYYSKPLDCQRYLEFAAQHA